MKKSELKEMIKAAFMAEGNYDEVEAAQKRAGDTTNSKFHKDLDKYKTSSNYGSTRVGEGEEDLDEMLARLSEEEVEEVVAEAKEEELEADLEADIDTPEGDEEVDVEVDAKEKPANDSIVIDKKIVSLSSLPGETRKILDTLETLRAQAEEFGDQKFITQVGNTITFFTRDFVVAGDAPNPAGIEEEIGDDSNTVEDEAGLGLEEIQRWKKLAGIAEIELPANIRNKANIEVKDAATMAKSLLDLYQQIQDKEQVNFSQNNDFKIALTYLKKLAKNVKGKEAPTQDDTTDMTMDMDVDVATTK